MKNLYIIFFIALFMSSATGCIGQNTFYLRARDANFNPKLETQSGRVVYKGNNRNLKKVFNENNISIFRNAFVRSKRSKLIRTWFFESDSKNALNDFLEYGSKVFEFGEIIEEPQLMDSYPNDYGITNPNGNTGLAIDLSYFDLIGVPEAWDYTVGSSNILVGISDGGITPSAPDFINRIIPNGVLSNGSSIVHGDGVTMILAGEGNNGQGSTGICQNCQIVFHYYSFGSSLTAYEKLEELASQGASVINCSFAASSYCNTCDESVNEIINDFGAIIVASSGNGASENFKYPASFDDVISVGAVGSGKAFTYDNIEEPGTATPSHYTITNLQHALGGRVAFDTNNGPPTPSNYADKAYIIGGRAIMNDKVDIVAPGASVFRYGIYLNNGSIDYTTNTSLRTSPAAPMVSGTIALMLDLNSCLDRLAIESILKSSSTYIAEFPFNRNSGFNFQWTNKHGSGTLHTGRAVKLVNDLINPNEIAYLSDQKFTRWDFEFEGISQHIEIRNQEFTEASTLNVLAKNRILIEENSLLEPNSDGNMLLEINPSLVIDTNCITNNRTSNKSKDSSDEQEMEDPVRYVIAPTKISNQMSIYERLDGDSDLYSFKIVDLMNREMFSKEGLSFNSSKEMTFNLERLNRGIYIVQGYSAQGEVILIEKIIKL